MKQQINLYQPVLRRQPALLSAVTLSWILGLAVLTVLALYGYGLWQSRLQARELVQLELRRDQIQADLIRMGESNQTALRRAEELDRRTRRLAQDRAAKQTLIDALQNRTLGNREGFGDYLESLARQRVEGLWLTAIHIEQGGDYLTMEGRSRSPEQVPRLLDRLRQELSFLGREFRTLSIRRLPDQQMLEFTLTNRPPATETP